MNAKVILCLLFLLSSFPRHLWALPILDRSYEVCGGNFFSFLGHQGQAFEVKTTGYLTSFDLYLSRGLSPVQTNGSITWEMRRTLGSGYPNFTPQGLLASGWAPSSIFPRPSAYVHFSITNPPLVRVGEGLAMVVQGSNSGGAWVGDSPGCGSGGFGYAFSLQTGSLDIISWAELGLQTYVEPFPAIPRPVLICPEVPILECGGSFTTFTSAVLDPSGYAVKVVWSLDGLPVQTNQIASGQAGTNQMSYIGSLSLGDHVLAISASNGRSEATTCAIPVLVRDTTPPTLGTIEATPNELWPPNGRMVNVVIQANASDACGSTMCRIISVEVLDPGTNSTQPADRSDWSLNGNSVELRATRSDRGETRVYSVILECADPSGNRVRGATTVTVPHDRKK